MTFHSTRLPLVWSATVRILVVLAFLIVAAVPAATANEPAPDRATARYEVRFMTGMIDHHHMALMMAELCEGRVVHPELLALCEQIKTAQMAEFEEMQSWLMDWYGVQHEPQMSPGMMRQREHMASLEGTEFEIEFMTVMIRHHWRAVVEARQCERRVYHQALRELCENIISAQLAEIAQMQTWFRELYGICHNGPKGGHHHGHGR